MKILSGVPAEIQTDYLPNTNLELCFYSDLLCDTEYLSMSSKENISVWIINPESSKQEETELNVW
jgi:hypothetical protein